MCGRFVSAYSAEEIAAHFGATLEALDASTALPFNYNVAPTDDVYAVVAGGDEMPVVRVFHWGLVPIWAKDTKIASSLINARSETIAEKPAFKRVFAKYRCIIPMSGFYEWGSVDRRGPALAVKGKPSRQPSFVYRIDGQPLAVAGVWSVWRDKLDPKDAPWLHTCSVITTAANATMSAIHDRMPVLLSRSEWQQWLDPAETDLNLLGSMLQPAPDSLLTMHRVSSDVNNVRNQGEHLIDPVDPVEDGVPTLF